MASGAHPYDLERFVAAQKGVCERALEELRAGAKQSHWMWFIFPQIAGLGSSPTARRYAIGSLAEAKAYLAHPVLGPRLEAATRLVNEIDGRGISDILGPIDAMKFHSCMTLFATAASDNAVFRTALDKYFRGTADPNTLARL